MYQPPHFVETIGVLHALIRAHPLGLLISTGKDGPIANPLPFLLLRRRRTAWPAACTSSQGPEPQWRLIAEDPETPVLIVFQGVDSDVTPSWYETKRETGKVVPTWNYAIAPGPRPVARCRGTSRLARPDRRADRNARKQHSVRSPGRSAMRRTPSSHRS